MEKITVEKINSGKRIDKFLSSFAKASADKVKEFFSFTRGDIIRQIKNGNILVNGKKVKPSYSLKERDIIEHGEWRIKHEPIVPNPGINLEIIYQDKNIIVINKPAGIQVHPDFHEKKNTLANALLFKFPEIKNVGDTSTSSGQVIMRPGIVHRLDKDTSGVMVVARNQKTFEELKNKFQNREIEKKYWAIVHGTINSQGMIEKPIARASNYKKQVIAGKKTKTKIRPAATGYKKIKNLGEYSLIEASPETGRMHQIRVHLSSIGHPVVGDKLYKKRGNRLAEAERQLLHAKNIKFELFGKEYFFQADLPDDFAQFLTKTS